MDTTGVVDALPRDLADSLAAAHAARSDPHFDICTVYTKAPGFGCSCGVPRLLEGLAAALLGRRETVAATPG